MNYGSVCSGIEAATCAWRPLGWRAAWFAENGKFPSDVLSHHYPCVPNHGDITKFKDWPDDAAIDVLVGGTPCQSFSIAGLRKGLDDPRGNLALTYLAIAHRYAPRWLVWENVNGILSSNDGHDFGTLLGGLAELGYGVAYRVLDAQFFGVPQQRRRVFVVGYLGDWRAAAAVLFERASLLGRPASGRDTRQDFAGSIDLRVEGRDDGLMVANAEGSVGLPILTRSNLGKQLNNQTPLVLVRGQAVRRLTPRECERLQGFPDDYTRIQVRGQWVADAPRYQALGDSMAVPVIGWIGRRIDHVESVMQAVA